MGRKYQLHGQVLDLAEELQKSEKRGPQRWFRSDCIFRFTEIERTHSRVHDKVKKNHIKRKEE